MIYSTEFIRYAQAAVILLRKRYRSESAQRDLLDRLGSTLRSKQAKTHRTIYAKSGYTGIYLEHLSQKCLHFKKHVGLRGFDPGLLNTNHILYFESTTVRTMSPF